MSEYLLGVATGCLVGGAVIHMFTSNYDEAKQASAVKVVQDEITNYVKQNPSQGIYECTTKTGNVLHIKAGDFQSGKITVSVADPVEPGTCKAMLNGAVAQPG